MIKSDSEIYRVLNMVEDSSFPCDAQLSSSFTIVEVECAGLSFCWVGFETVAFVVD